MIVFFSPSLLSFNLTRRQKKLDSGLSLRGKDGEENLRLDDKSQENPINANKVLTDSPRPCIIFIEKSRQKKNSEGLSGRWNGGTKEGRDEVKQEPVPQGQYVVRDTRCPARLRIRVKGSRAAAPMGMKSCRTQGDFRSSCLNQLTVSGQNDICRFVNTMRYFTKDVEAIDRFYFGGWDSYQYLNYKMEAEAEALEAALKSTASTSLYFTE